MAFEIAEVTACKVTNANARREFHGDEPVRAIDLTFALTGENTLLDLIAPGLREHHYCNKALTVGQQPLPDVVIPLPNLRQPKLPLSYTWDKGQSWRGYRFILDYGLQDAAVDFTDAVLKGIKYELNEGGSVTIGWTVSYNGDELADNEVYGRLAALATDGEVHIKLLAPPELIAAKKGYRAGRPDAVRTAAQTDGQGELGVDGDDGAAGEDDGPLDAGTPEGAFAAAAGKAVH